MNLSTTATLVAAIAAVVVMINGYADRRFDQMETQMDRIVDAWFLTQQRLAEVEKSLVVEEVLRKCAENPGMCGEGN